MTTGLFSPATRSSPLTRRMDPPRLASNNSSHSTKAGQLTGSVISMVKVSMPAPCQAAGVSISAAWRGFQSPGDASTSLADGIAALLDGALPAGRIKRGPLVLVVTGANIDMDQHRRIVDAAPTQPATHIAS